MTQAQIDRAIAKGVAERKKAHWAKMKEDKTAMQKRIACCNTAENFKALDEVLSDLCADRHHSHDKNVEYKHYEDAGFDDDYIEMYQELDTELYERKKKLKL
jgi:hypothetical protein